MIKTRYRVSFAEAMFQYALARILARRFNYHLEAPPLPLFPATFEQTPGDEVYGPALQWFGHWPVDSQGWRKVQRAELFYAPAARLTLCGAFQRAELYLEEEDLIRESWFSPVGKRPVRAASDFVISLLSAEVFGEPSSDTTLTGESIAVIPRKSDSVLTDGEIRRLARTVPHQRLYIVLENPADPRMDRLKDLHAEFVCQGAREDFLFVQSFQKIAISQNPLHWWAAFLSKAKEIYFPPCNRGEWGDPAVPLLAHAPAHCGIDLRIMGDRYIHDW
ncbi:MAG: hypothetical protein V4710_04230 [Verrucomicrobiota bacterium]